MARMYERRESEESLGGRPEREGEGREQTLHTTGLRKKRLACIVALLVLLAFLTLALLIMNIMLIRTLDMSSQGMRFLRFYTVANPKTGQEEKVVHFTGREMDLGKVVAESGHVGGASDSDLNIYGSRVIMEGEPGGSRFVLQEDGCTMEQISDFKVVNSHNNRPVFSARHPLVPLDKKIKRLSSSKIITNKIRSPVNEKLQVNVEDVSIRGNEAIRIEAKNVHFASGTALSFNTSVISLTHRDGSIRMRGRVYIGSAHWGLPLSQSPSLSASLDAFRLCVCNGGRLFAVPGNKPCSAELDFCSA